MLQLPYQTTNTCSNEAGESNKRAPHSNVLRATDTVKPPAATMDNGPHNLRPIITAIPKPAKTKAALPYMMALRGDV